MSKTHPKFKPNSPYAESIGKRPNDKLDLFDRKENRNIDADVYSYDRDIYKDINDFFSKYHYMHKKYQLFLVQQPDASIKDFLEENANLDEFDVFDEVSLRYRNYLITYVWKNKSKKCKVLGTFRIQNYDFFPTDQFLFLRSRATGKAYLYRGEVY